MKHKKKTIQIYYVNDDLRLKLSMAMVCYPGMNNEYMLNDLLDRRLTLQYGERYKQHLDEYRARINKETARILAEQSVSLPEVEKCNICGSIIGKHGYCEPCDEKRISSMCKDCGKVKEDLSKELCNQCIADIEYSDRKNEELYRRIEFKYGKVNNEQI